MGKGGFGQSGKYKKIIKSIYPANDEGDIQVHNIGKLIHFCEIAPQKLLKVSQYLEKRAVRDVNKQRIRSVGVTIKIYQDLIKGCRKNLNLFARGMLKFLKLLLDGRNPDLMILATETLSQFGAVLDESSSQYPELEQLVPILIEMCQNENSDIIVRTRLREGGLRGLRAYIGILDLTDELDSFITRHTDYDKRSPFIPIILDNMNFNAHYHANLNVSSNGDGASDESVQNLALEVLRDIFNMANVSVTSVLKAILRYLDTQNKWIPNVFALNCFRAVYNCKPQHGQILMGLLIQHLSYPDDLPTAVKRQIVMDIVEFFGDSTGHYMGILDTFSKLLVSSVEIVSQDQRVKDYEQHIELQVAIVNSISIICKKLYSNNLIMDAFNYLCEKLSQSKHIKETGLSDVVLVCTKCFLLISKELNMGRQKPVQFLTQTSIELLKDLALHLQPEIRMLSQQIYHNLTIPGQSVPEYYLTNSNNKNEIPPNAEENYLHDIVRACLCPQIKLKHNQPANYVACSNTLNILLLRGGQEELTASFPIIFAIQKPAMKWKKVNLRNSNTIAMLVYVYLYNVAKIFECPKLTAYIDDIMEKRKKVGQICEFVDVQKEPIGVLVAKQPYYPIDPNLKKTPFEYIPFERELVSDLICTESALKSDPRLKRLLAKKFHRATIATITIANLPPLRSESSSRQSLLFPGVAALNEAINTESKAIFSPVIESGSPVGPESSARPQVVLSPELVGGTSEKDAPQVMSWFTYRKLMDDTPHIKISLFELPFSDFAHRTSETSTKKSVEWYNLNRLIGAEEEDDDIENDALQVSNDSTLSMEFGLFQGVGIGVM